MTAIRRTRLRLLGLIVAFVIVNILFSAINIHPVFKVRHFRAASNNNNLLCVNSNCDTSKPPAGRIKKSVATLRHDGVSVYTKYKVEHLHLKPLRDVRPLRNNFGPVLNDVTSFRYSINAQSQCQQTLNKDDLLVVVVVVSAADYFHKRQLVRQSWAARLANSTWARHVFLTGKAANITTQEKIEEEHKAFGDVVQLDMIDSYDILTLKSVALLHWANNFCYQVPFILKCDDDVYVNPVRLAMAVSAIQREIPYYQSGLYGTKIIIDNPPQRKLESKHYVSLEVWPWATYPSYLYGGCYLMGRESLGPLLAAAQTTPFFPFEDLYLIGLCSRKAEIPLWTFDKMFIMENENRTAETCFVGESITWQTRSDAQFSDSHQAVESLLENKTKCDYTSNSSANNINPKEIHFKLIDSAEYETWSRNMSQVLAETLPP